MMMEIKEIKDLMTFFDKSKSTVIEIKDADFSIRLEKASEMEPEKIVADIKEMNDKADKADKTDKAATKDMDDEIVKAPLVGIFYAAASPEAEAYVQVGSRVKKGDVLCLIEAMKMMSEITAPRDGVIEKIYVKNQDIVGFEDPLFALGD